MLPAPPAAPVRLALSLGNSVVSLAAVTVEGSRTGQARALNQQRAAQNLTQIVSADFSGQFPDKNIADAVKRLPGVTVETDRDTGGSEGRYVTVRGMNADFNAVTINGMRVNVSASAPPRTAAAALSSNLPPTTRSPSRATKRRAPSSISPRATNSSATGRFTPKCKTP